MGWLERSGAAGGWQSVWVEIGIHCPAWDADVVCDWNDPELAFIVAQLNAIDLYEEARPTEKERHDPRWGLSESEYRELRAEEEALHGLAG